MMNNIDKIKDIAVKIMNNVRKWIKNRTTLVKGKMYKAQVEAENRASGLAMKDIKNELQSILYSSKIGRFLISFCGYIIYALVCSEIILFLLRESTNSKVVDVSFELGIIELFLAIIVGCICYIKNRNMPILIYSMTTAITYFLKLTEKTYYNILSVFIVVSMSLISISIIRTFIKTKEVDGIMGMLRKVINVEEEDNEKVSRTEIMIRCPKCGSICSKDDNVCANCGEIIRMQKRAERNSKKSVNKKASTIIKKSVKKANYVINSGKTNNGDDTVVMKDIEEKIRKNAED